MISYLLWIIEKFLQELYGHLLLSTSRKSIHLSVDEVSVEFFLKEKSICTYTEMVSLIISLEAMRMIFFVLNLAAMYSYYWTLLLKWGKFFHLEFSSCKSFLIYYSTLLLIIPILLYICLIDTAPGS